MGVDRKDYIIVGVDIKSFAYDKDDADDFYEKYLWQDKEGSIVFLEDLYNGTYFLVGEVLQASDGYREGLDYSLFGRENQIENAKLRVKGFIREHFGIDSEPHVIVKTHWS